MFLKESAAVFSGVSISILSDLGSTLKQLVGCRGGGDFVFTGYYHVRNMVQGIQWERGPMSDQFAHRL